MVKVLVTPSLHELLIGEGLDSMEGLLTNLEGFWLVAAVLGEEEEEGSLEGFGMLAEVVGANLRVKFKTRVSRKNAINKRKSISTWRLGLAQGNPANCSWSAGCSREGFGRSNHSQLPFRPKK